MKKTISLLFSLLLISSFVLVGCAQKEEVEEVMEEPEEVMEEEVMEEEDDNQVGVEMSLTIEGDDAS